MIDWQLFFIVLAVVEGAGMLILSLFLIINLNNRLCRLEDRDE